MGKRTSKKPSLRWSVIAKIVKQNGIAITEAKGARKKLRKVTSQGKLTTTVHVHNKGSEIKPCYTDQIIDKFGKDENEFY